MNLRTPPKDLLDRADAAIDAAITAVDTTQHAAALISRHLDEFSTSTTAVVPRHLRSWPPLARSMSLTSVMNNTRHWPQILAQVPLPGLRGDCPIY
jgi:hypothetical protein